jgi:hypothetical protein
MQVTDGHVQIDPNLPVPQIAVNVQRKVKKVKLSLYLTK